MSLTDGVILILAAGGGDFFLCWVFLKERIVLFVLWRFISRIRRGETGCGCGCDGCSKSCASRKKKDPK